MKFKEWDGYDAYGIPASDIKRGYPTTGRILFLTEDDGRLLEVVYVGVEGGRTPITAANLEATKKAVLAARQPPPPAEDDGLQELKDTVAWLMMFVTTGDA